MEVSQGLDEKPTMDSSSSVDTSRPFRSVKEAIAVFGEQLFIREIHAPKPYISSKTEAQSWPYLQSPSPANSGKEVDQEHAVLSTSIVTSLLPRHPKPIEEVDHEHTIISIFSASSSTIPDIPYKEVDQEEDATLNTWDSPISNRESHQGHAILNTLNTPSLPSPPKANKELAVVDTLSSFSSPRTPKPSKDIHHAIAKTCDKRIKEDQQVAIVDAMKKLEAELEQTKAEVRILKERESETEVVLASLNAELHKSMSKLAKAEAAAAANAVAAKTAYTGLKEEERRRDWMIRMENSPTLAEILSLADKQTYFYGENEKNHTKKKPIVPLVSDLFFWKKGATKSPPPAHIYSSPQLNLY